MASGKGNFLSAAFLKHWTGEATFTPPADVDFELYTAAPTGAGGGTEVSTSGTAYARQNYPLDTSNWSAVASQQTSNTNEVNWATATANWGTVVAASIKAGGTENIHYWGNLTTNRVVNTGDSVRFAVGGVVVGES